MNLLLACWGPTDGTLYLLQVMNTVNKMPYHVGSEKINQPRNVWNMSKMNGWKTKLKLICHSVNQYE